MRSTLGSAKASLEQSFFYVVRRFLRLLRTLPAKSARRPPHAEPAQRALLERTVGQIGQGASRRVKRCGDADTGGADVRTRPCGQRAFPRSAFSRRRTRRSLLRMAPLADQLFGHGIIQFTSCHRPGTRVPGAATAREPPRASSCLGKVAASQSMAFQLAALPRRLPRTSSTSAVSRRRA